MTSFALVASFDPQIAINDSGIAFVIWEQDDGTGRFGVLANRFD